MKYKLFYSRIKALLDEHRVQSDHNAIWQGVQLKMKKRKRRRLALFSLLLMGSLSLASWGYMVLESDNTSFSWNEIPQLQNTEIQQQKVQDFIPETKSKIIRNNVPKTASQELFESESSERVFKTKTEGTSTTAQISISNIPTEERPRTSIENAPLLMPLMMMKPTVQVATNTTVKPLPLQNMHLMSSTVPSLQSVPEIGLNLLSGSSGWSASIYFSPGMISRDFKAAQSPYNELAETRTEAEKPVRALSFGADVRYKLNSHWYISSGLEYNRYIDKFETSYEFTTKEVDPNGIVKYEIRTRGSIEAIYGSVEVTRTQNVYRKTYNRYHLLSVPLILGYVQEDHSLTWGAHIGVQAQSLVKASGAAFGLDNTVVDLSSYVLENQTLYTAQLQMNALIGIELGYNIFPHWNIYTSPELIKGLGSLSGKAVAITQEIDRYRIRVGLRRTF